MPDGLTTITVESIIHTYSYTVDMQGGWDGKNKTNVYDPASIRQQKQ